jgi:hypothetical protein
LKGRGAYGKTALHLAWFRKHLFLQTHLSLHTGIIYGLHTVGTGTMARILQSYQKIVTFAGPKNGGNPGGAKKQQLL